MKVVHLRRNLDVRAAWEAGGYKFDKETVTQG